MDAFSKHGNLAEMPKCLKIMGAAGFSLHMPCQTHTWSVDIYWLIFIWMIGHWYLWGWKFDLLQWYTLQTWNQPVYIPKEENLGWGMRDEAQIHLLPNMGGWLPMPMLHHSVARVNWPPNAVKAKKHGKKIYFSHLFQNQGKKWRDE